MLKVEQLLGKPLRKLLNGPIARATIRTSFVLGLRLGVQAGTLLLVARMLGPSDYGAFAAIAALAVLMGTFATCGTHLVLLAEVSKSPDQRQPVLAYAVPITLISGSVLFLLYLATGQFWLASTSVPLQVMACIGLTETLLLPLYLLPATEDLALEKTARSQLMVVFPLALRMAVAGMVMVLAPAQPLALFAWLYLATALLALVCMKVCKHDAWLQPKHWKLPNRVQLKHSIGYATLSLTAAGPSELDKMLAVKLLPLGVSGLYAAASRVIGAATLPVTALLLSALPRLFRQAGEHSAQSQRLNRWIYLSVLIYGMALAGLLWFAAPAVQWLFGSQYHGMDSMLRWLCLAVPGLVLRMTVANELMTSNQPWLRAGFEVLGMATIAIAALTLYPQFGPKKITLTLTISEWGMVLAGVFFILKVRRN